MWKKCQKIFLEAIFFSFLHKFFFLIILHDITGLENSHCFSTNHNSLKLHCSHPINIELFFHVYDDDDDVDDDDDDDDSMK